MPTIAPSRRVCTEIDVYRVPPKSQQRLLDLLAEATERVLRHQPGFLSASLHRSLDGTQVIAYTQWESREALEAARHEPTVRSQLAAAERLGSVETHAYEVFATFDPRSREALDGVTTGPNPYDVRW